MRIVELIIDEKDETSGIDAISVVENGAIESDFIALKKHEVELKEIDTEKRILMGAALIPNKQIYRTNEKKEEYYIYFSEATIRKASELFLMNGNQNNATLEHNEKLKGMSVVESWIVEGENDKSKNYGFDVPKGTWMIAMKVNNDKVWQQVKEGKIKGFSIEGYFADKYEMSLKNIDMEEKVTIEKIKALITKSELKTNKINLSLVDDYIKQTKNTQKAYDDFNKSYNSFMGFRKQAEAYIENLIPQVQKLEQINLEALNKSKELGINWRDTKEYKQAEDILIRLDVKYLERMKTKLETFQTA